MWRNLVVNYVADQKQRAPSDIGVTRCTYKFVQSDDISRPEGVSLSLSLSLQRGCD